MHIHLEPVMHVFRGYDDPNGYEKRHRYRVVGSVFLLGNGRARVFATHGELDRETIENLAAELRKLGVHTVLVERHGIEQELKTGRATASKEKRA